MYDWEWNDSAGRVSCLNAFTEKKSKTFFAHFEVMFLAIYWWSKCRDVSQSSPTKLLLTQNDLVGRLMSHDDLNAVSVASQPGQELNCGENAE